jgi:hypothetical protein
MVHKGKAPQHFEESNNALHYLLYSRCFVVTRFCYAHRRRIDPYPASSCSCHICLQSYNWTLNCGLSFHNFKNDGQGSTCPFFGTTCGINLGNTSDVLHVNHFMMSGLENKSRIRLPMID